MAARIGKQAVVVGAGMAGLTAARSLADFFERVVVLENDALPKEATHRPGTPQSKHIHALLAGGLQALCRLLPGFIESLSQAGADSFLSNTVMFGLALLMLLVPRPWSYSIDMVRRRRRKVIGHAAS
jgi:2-polyprenyl-6-methoxyphenol hydroxylase-like FAD-dependent oxidoreductase